jgi:DNA modification methylase
MEVNVLKNTVNETGQTDENANTASHIGVVMRRNNEVLFEINKIYCENNLDTMKRMPDNFIALTVTSPPYDNLRDYKGYSFDFEAIAKELYRVTKQGGVVVWVVGDATINGSESGTSFKQALYFKEIGFNLHDTMIYYKNSPLPAQAIMKRYAQQFEYSFVLSKGMPEKFNPIMEFCNNAGTLNKTKFRRASGELCESKNIIPEYKIKGNVFMYSANYATPDTVAYEHPAIFPERLAYDHIISWSNEGDLVYDPFMGSGTTAKAAIASGRNYIGSEISEEYCQIIKKRLHPLLNNIFVQEEKTEC